jgi:hypothetical protein
MRYDDFKGTKKGELIVIGNGISLLNVPFGFLLSRPTFALNHFTAWTPWFRPSFWLSTDHIPAKDMIDKLPGVPKFLSEWTIDIMESEGLDDPEVMAFRFLDKVDGIPYAKGTAPGSRYSTSILAASHIGVDMGFTTIFWVGFDCTRPTTIEPNPINGRSATPHFYDPIRPSMPAESWNRQAGAFVHWAQTRGVRVVNLSYPTDCTTVPRDHYSNYWKEMTRLEYEEMFLGRFSDEAPAEQ